jgi:hypothetical protein
MTAPKLFIPLALFAGLLAMTACSHNLFSQDASLPSTHPQALGEGRVDCTECHEDDYKGEHKGVLKPYGTFSHSSAFVKNHRFYAAGDDRLCAFCHKGSFCADCHANEVEIRPAIKHGDRPDRELVHRGDFFSLHMIEGQIDPVSCYRCHGRTNNEQCIVCHR